MQSAEPFVQCIQEWIDLFMRRSMHKLFHYSKENHLSMSQIGTLFRIHGHGSGVSDLGDDLGITSAAASQMLDRLVKDGLILRTEDPEDRRAKQIVLTDKGKQVLQDSINVRQAWLDDLAVRLSPAEKEQIMSAIQILINAANRLEE